MLTGTTMRFGGRPFLFANVANVVVLAMQPSLRSEKANGTTWAQIDSEGTVGIAGQEPDPAADSATKLFRSNIEQTSEGSDVQTIMLKSPVRLHQNPEASTTGTNSGNNSGSNIEVLPIWAKVVCGSLTTIIIMSIFFCVKARINENVPGGVDKERLHIVLQETIERVNALKDELEVQIKANERMPEGDPELEAARVEARELQQRTEDRAKEIREAADSMAEQKHELIAGAERAHEAFKEAIEVGRERVETFSKVEATDLYKKVEEAVTEGNIAAWEAPEWMASNEDEDFLTLPPLMNLVQGAFASKCIHSLRHSCNWRIIADIIMLTLSAVMFYFDRHAPCPDMQVWVWHIGLAASNSLDLLARVLLVRWCSDAILALRETRDEMAQGRAEVKDQGVWQQMAFLKRGGENYFESYFKYKNIVMSWTYAFLQLKEFFVMSWGIFGLWISVMDIVEDELACRAWLALKYLHLYSTFFVMLLTMNLLNLILVVIGYLSSSRFVSGPILKAAKSFDDDTMKGIPLALTLVESFVLTNSSGSLSMSQREVKDDMRELTAQLEELEERLKKKKRVSEHVHSVAAECRTQEEYMDRYQDIMDTSFRQAKPLVGLIAANVRTEDLAISDPDAGSSRIAGIRMAVNARRERPGLRRHGATQGDESEENPEEANAADVDSF